ncbi:MAG TPA: ORF6N domain-containing protein [Thermodesulfovibrionales bacterium]|nr:ORF6N domain-containing protein [Thermodesulfovibrionales bacterium]
MKELIPVEIIEKKILLIRGEKVMLDADLAELYGVEVKHLKRQVRRNIGRFPADFMIQLSKEEYEFLRRHFGTLKRGEHSKYLPYAFTEQGVAMLSSVLNSERAVRVNIEIMRAFVRLRQMLASNAELARKLEALEKKYDSQFKVVFDAIRQLMASPETKKRKIGFHRDGPAPRKLCHL